MPNRAKGEAPAEPRSTEDMPLRRLVALWRLLHPLPPPTGEIADKAFVDELSGDF